jgi:hypothetical protein
MRRALLILLIAGCVPPRSTTASGGATSSLDPEGCGDISASDIGRKLHAFFVATAELDRQVTEIETAVRGSCTTIGGELQMAPADLQGPTKDMCTRVFTTVKLALAGALKTPQGFVVDFKPGVCTVDVDAAARAAAQCEADGSTAAVVTCDGTCTQPRPDGSCAGGCNGAADVHASAQCKSQAEIHAAVTMQCTDPQLAISLKPEGLADAAKAEQIAGALRKGLPRVLWVAARVKPLGHAVEGWAHAADELSQSGTEIASQFAERALCVGGQIAAALSAVQHIQASIQVSVDIEAQVSGTVGPM